MASSFKKSSNQNITEDKFSKMAVNNPRRIDAVKQRREVYTVNNSSLNVTRKRTYIADSDFEPIEIKSRNVLIHTNKLTLKTRRLVIL